MVMNKEITLMDLLDSREKRVNHQKELIEQYGGVLVSMTLNIPGPVKDKPEYRRILKEGMRKVETSLKECIGCDMIPHIEVRELSTGPEGYICVNTEDPMIIKKIAVEIEEEDLLGRLLDIDVIMDNGSISRSSLGISPRKCLLCEENAKVCARSRAHDMRELLKRIDEIIAESGI